jgi:hypothetical protein
MNRRIQKQSESVATLCLSPNLGGEIINWQKARIAFQHQRTKGNQDYYCRCSDELGQALCRWRVEQPELYEQFKMFFQSHPEY